MSTDSDTPQKALKRCAKCDSDDMLFVEAIRGNFGSGNVIPLSGLFIFDSVKVDRYVCMSCGFCEEWILNPEDREDLRRWYRPDSRRASNNDRWRRWGQSVAKLKRQLFSGRPTIQNTHDKEQP